MDENQLLLRHAATWAEERRRPFDAELVALVLDLRSGHDGLSPNQWQTGSAEHLMLVRWPANGPTEPPDVDALVGSLDTFWGFLRSTGRMAGASAQPAQLRREAKRAAPKMAAACADESRFGVAKQMLGFGSEIGIDFSDVPDIAEANRRFQQVVEAWNALPDDQRMARSQHWPLGSPVTAEPDDGDNPDDLYDLYVGDDLYDEPDDDLFEESEWDDPADWGAGWFAFDPATLPNSPLFAFDASGALVLPRPINPAASTAQARASGYVRSLLAMATWVGDGREITTTTTLRPAVGRQAYTELGLAAWEREVADRKSTFTGRPEWAASDTSGRWRSASECLALERLWRPALSTGLVTTKGRVARFDASAVPTSDQDWLNLCLLATVTLALGWEEGRCLDLAFGILAQIDLEYGQPTRPAELAERWWDSPANRWRRAADSRASDIEQGPDSLHERLLHRTSDGELAGWLAAFSDAGLWREHDGSLVGTELGRDLLIVLLGTVSDAGPAE